GDQQDTGLRRARAVRASIAQLPAHRLRVLEQPGTAQQGRERPDDAPPRTRRKLIGGATLRFGQRLGVKRRQTIASGSEHSYSYAEGSGESVGLSNAFLSAGLTGKFSTTFFGGIGFAYHLS